MAYAVATQQGLNGQGPDLVALWVKIWWLYNTYIYIHIIAYTVYTLLNSKALLDTPQREFIRPLAPSSVVFMELFRCLSCKQTLGEKDQMFRCELLKGPFKLAFDSGRFVVVLL